MKPLNFVKLTGTVAGVTGGETWSFWHLAVGSESIPVLAFFAVKPDEIEGHWIEVSGHLGRAKSKDGPKLAVVAHKIKAF